MNRRLTTERIKNILQAIIIQYIYTGEPVGSSMLNKKYILELSPATIRNIMSEMEEMVYLMQPHASAGRIPTDKGFRFYVDSILKIKELSPSEMEKIKTRCQPFQEIEKVMGNASNILSSLSDW